MQSIVCKVSDTSVFVVRCSFLYESDFACFVFLIPSVPATYKTNSFEPLSVYSLKIGFFNLTHFNLISYQYFMKWLKAVHKKK